MAAGPPSLNDWYSRQGMQVKGGGITMAGGGFIKAGQTRYNVGTGFFLGHDAGVPKFSIGNPAGSYLTWDGTNLAFTGNLTGASGTFTGNLNVLGTANIGGSTSYSGTTYAMTLNLAGAATHGGIGVSTAGRGLHGLSTSATLGIGIGVHGDANSGSGLRGSAGNGIGVEAISSSGVALSVGGTSAVIKWNGYSYTAPSGSTTTFMRNDGTWAAPPYPVTLAGSETLTNKTLTTPVINGFSGTGNGTVTGLMDVTVLKTGTYTVATLPAAGTYTGGRVAVTDALGPAFTAVVVGGGAVPCPVYSDGTNWRCG